jgi:hypothetical protein
VTTYRYLFADLLTNQVIAELPLTAVNFTQQLNAAGTFTGTMLLTDSSETTLNVINGTIPARTALYVDRNGVLVWGGIIWSRDYNSETQHVSLTAREFESYFEKRVINTTQAFTNLDQFSIVQALVNQAQAVTNGNIGVITDTSTSGVTVSRTFYNYELKNVYQAILDLSRGGLNGVTQYGFDFNINVAYDVNGNPSKTLALATKSGTRYSATSQTAPLFEFPSGNVISYEYPEDGSLVANKVYVTGAGSQVTPVTYTDATKIVGGWAVLEDVANYSDITDTNLLTSLAVAQVNGVGYPPTTLKIVAPPYVDPVFGTYGLGDDVRVRIRDDRFPNGIDTTYRLVALTVTAGETSGEKITLTLTLPTT